MLPPCCQAGRCRRASAVTATAALSPPPRYCRRPAALMPIAPALLPHCRCDMTLAEGVGCTTIDGLRSTVAVDDTMRLQTRGSGTEGGDGGGGRGLLVDGAAGDGGRRMRQERRRRRRVGEQAKAEMVCGVSLVEYFVRRVRRS